MTKYYLSIGVLFKNEDVWYVNYVTETIEVKMLPLHPGDLSDDNELFTGKEVQFEIIDEFVEPSLYEGVPLYEGQPYAKLKNN